MPTCQVTGFDCLNCVDQTCRLLDRATRARVIPPVVIDYTNHRGERSLRTISPTANPIFYGSTTWHTEEQWLLEAWDLEKGQLRTFAVKDIHAWKTPKEATVEVSIAKQLQQSMELNARMVNRLKKLQAACNDFEPRKLVIDDIDCILKDEDF